MLIFHYPTKKDLKAAVGQRLKYAETSMFGFEYKADGVITGSNRPKLTGFKREFYANVTMENGLIKKVD